MAATTCLSGPSEAEPQLSLSTSYFWELDAPWFGGFSALEMSHDGTSATILSDRGTLIEVDVLRMNGVLSDLTVTSRKTLRDAQGAELADRVHDAEGLAVGHDGRSFVSFEFEHRVTTLNRSNGITASLKSHPDFAGFSINKGLEALAIGPEGDLFAMAEQTSEEGTTAPLYRYDGTQWVVAYLIPITPPFLPVGADFDTQGRLYLLERTVTPLGFRSRIRRFDLGSPDQRAETLLTTFPARFDNLEAISVWQDTAGKMHLTMISDDNFLPLQRTQIVEYTLTE